MGIIHTKSIVRLLLVLIILLQQEEVSGFTRISYRTAVPQSALVKKPSSTAQLPTGTPARSPSYRHSGIQLQLSSWDDDPLFDGRTTLNLLGGQSLLVVAGVLAAYFLDAPFELLWTSNALIQGLTWTAPLFLLAFALDFIEDGIPALQDVTKATQRSVLYLLGGTWKPLLAILVSVALGCAAGVGEELIFRGVLQPQLTDVVNSEFWSISLSSLLFGALHAVTPLYAVLATLASVFFGSLYVAAQHNLAVPIISHAVYDVGALMWAHWTVSQMTSQEQEAILNWPGPNIEGETS